MTEDEIIREICELFGLDFKEEFYLRCRPVVATELIADIKGTKAQLVSMLPDSLALKVDELDVSFGQQRRFLFEHGNRQCKLLSSLSGVPLGDQYYFKLSGRSIPSY